MTPYTRFNKEMLSSMRKNISIMILVAFLITSIRTPGFAQITYQSHLPAPGVMVHLSPEFTPAHLKGIIIHPDNPLNFDFIIQKGDKALGEVEKKQEYTKLVKYFLASLAVPDENQWVNLSPYEKNRVIKEDFGKTEMGRDLLAQDYMLKQITASLIYPKDQLGQKFWDEVYKRAYEQYGTTNIPVNTFNKVWIMPDRADVYEKGNAAYVYNSHLKVMLEEDYLSLEKHTALSSSQVFGNDKGSDNKTHALGSQIVREIVLPALEKEINEGQNFAMLRQVYSGMILAAWYKRALKESLLGKIYADKAKVKGIDQDVKNNEAIYQQYLKAFKKGVFNYIKEDVDKYTKETIPRKYFSGGFSPRMSEAMIVHSESDVKASQAMMSDLNGGDRLDVTSVKLREEKEVSAAMVTLTDDHKSKINEIIAERLIVDLKSLSEDTLLSDIQMHQDDIAFILSEAEEAFKEIGLELNIPDTDLKVFEDKYWRSDKPWGTIQLKVKDIYDLIAEHLNTVSAAMVSLSGSQEVSINHLIADLLVVDLDKVTRDAKLIDLNMSEPDVYTLVTNIEDTFAEAGIILEIPGKDIDDFTMDYWRSIQPNSTKQLAVEDVYNLVAKHLGAAVRVDQAMVKAMEYTNREVSDFVQGFVRDFNNATPRASIDLQTVWKDDHQAAAREVMREELKVFLKKSFPVLAADEFSESLYLLADGLMKYLDVTVDLQGVLKAKFNGILDRDIRIYYASEFPFSKFDKLNNGFGDPSDALARWARNVVRTTYVINSGAIRELYLPKYEIKVPKLIDTSLYLPLFLALQNKGRTLGLQELWKAPMTQTRAAEAILYSHGGTGSPASLPFVNADGQKVKLIRMSDAFGAEIINVPVMIYDPDGKTLMTKPSGQDAYLLSENGVIRIVEAQSRWDAAPQGYTRAPLTEQDIVRYIKDKYLHRLGTDQLSKLRIHLGVLLASPSTIGQRMSSDVINLTTKLQTILDLHNTQKTSDADLIRLFLKAASSMGDMQRIDALVKTRADQAMKYSATLSKGNKHTFIF